MKLPKYAIENHQFTIIFTVLFLSFPAGLVLYWLVNNILSVLQQWYIMRRYEKSKVKAHAKK